MSKQEKQRFIYDPVSRQKIDVSEEVYGAYYRPIWAMFKRAHDHGTCRATQSQWWLCQGDCAVCRFHYRDKHDSLELMAESGKQTADYSPTIDPESIAVDVLYFEGLLKRLDELMPEARKIGELRLRGLTDADIAEQIGIKRTTFLSRLKKAKEKLCEEFPDSSL